MGFPKTSKRRTQEANGTQKRLFTLDEANRSLPYVRRVVADIVKQHKRVCSLEDRCYNAQTLEGGAHIERLREAYMSDLEKLRDLMEELALVGCELRDFRRGLIDFHAMMAGRPIELSWKLGEEKIEHWHECVEDARSRRRIDASLLDEPLREVTPA